MCRNDGVKYLSERFHSYLAPGFLFLIFFLTECWINPIGNFPLNDDWVYVRVLRSLHEHHYIDTRFWGGAAMLSHILYGELFVTLFGFSITILRIATLVSAFIGLIFLYRLLREFAGCSNRNAMFGTFILLFNPLFLSLANTYMTDVPFVSMLIIGLYAYLRYENGSSRYSWVLAVFCFTAAILSRQLSLTLVAAVGLYGFIQHRLRKPVLFLPVIVPIVSLGIFEYWHRHQEGSHISAGYSYIFYSVEHSDSLLFLKSFTVQLCKRWTHVTSITGFVCFPLLIPYLFSFLRKRHDDKIKTILISLPFLLLVGVSMVHFPLGNYLYNTGIGADTLAPPGTLPGPEDASAFFPAMLILAFLGAWGGLLFLTHQVLRFLSHTKKTGALLFIMLVCFLFYYLAICLSNALFDRYFLFFGVFIIPCMMISAESDVNYKFALPLIILMAFFSANGTKDYLQKNRQRWEAIDFLKTRIGASDAQISAGYEHEGLFFGETSKWFDKWKNEPAAIYLVSAKRNDGYQVLKTFPYQRFIPYTTDTIFVLKRHAL